MTAALSWRARCLIAVMVSAGLAGCTQRSEPPAPTPVPPASFASLLPPPVQRPPPVERRVPATGEPGTAEGEIVSLFEEYQTAFISRDGRKFLDLHTSEEQQRQVTTCVRLLVEAAPKYPQLDETLTACGVIGDLRAVALEYDPNDPTTFEAALRVLRPRISDPARIVGAAIESLHLVSEVRPELYNLQVEGERATAVLELKSSKGSDRTQLVFVKGAEGWRIAEEKALPRRLRQETTDFPMGPAGGTP